MIIFFQEDIGEFKSNSGMNVNPIPCTLITNEIGFYLGEEWESEVSSKVSVLIKLPYNSVTPTNTIWV